MATNIVEEFQHGGYTYQLVNNYCNKPKCTKCPHGPYWYQTFRRRDGKPVRNYIGKELPIGIERITETG